MILSLCSTCAVTDCSQYPAQFIAYKNQTSSGSLFTFKCVANETVISGANPIACGTNGTFASVLPNCIARTCQLPPTNGTYRTHAYSNYVGDVLRFACAAGYETNATVLNSTCLSDGNWDNAFPACYPKSCQPPPGGVNATVGYTDLVIGSTASYACLAGYRYESGTFAATCLDDKTWSSPPLKCTLITCPELNVTLSGLNVSPLPGLALTVGVNMHFSCSLGYQFLGERTLQCGHTGKWNEPVPTCAREYACLFVCVLLCMTACTRMCTCVYMCACVSE